MPEGRGLGKCRDNHAASYGYPMRPPDPYPFCPQCGGPVVWACPKCKGALPEDSAELQLARFCRYCGAPYFNEMAEA